MCSKASRKAKRAKVAEALTEPMLSRLFDTALRVGRIDGTPVVYPA